MFVNSALSFLAFSTLKFWQMIGLISLPLCYFRKLKKVSFQTKVTASETAVHLVFVA